jgi:flagellar hook assembly protein FlgD
MRRCRWIASALLVLLLVMGMGRPGHAAGQLYALLITPDVISPNGDGVAEMTTILVRGFGVAGGKAIRVEIADQAGRVRRVLAPGDGGDLDPHTFSVLFDGRDESGQFLSDGVYTVVARAEDSGDELRAPLTVDRTRTGIAGVSMEPVYFTAQTAIRAHFGTETRWKLILFMNGRTLRTFEGQGIRMEVVWDGRDERGVPLPDGAYPVQLLTYDGQGRESVSWPGIVVKDTVVEGVDLQIDRKVIGPPSSWADRATISITALENGYYRFDLTSPSGQLIRSVEGKVLGLNPQSVVVRAEELPGSGTYGWRMTVLDIRGNAMTAHGSIVLDADPPEIAIGPLPEVTLQEHLILPLRISDPSGLARVSLQRDGAGQPLLVPIDPAATYISIPLLVGTQEITLVAEGPLGNRRSIGHRLTRLAAPRLGVYWKGAPVAYDVGPEMVDGRTMVPLRKTAETMGFQVVWDEATRSVLLAGYGRSVTLKVGSRMALVNGKAVEMEVAPYLREGRTMVPLRLVSEGLGFSVTWDEPTQSVIIHPAGNRE